MGWSGEGWGRRLSFPPPPEQAVPCSREKPSLQTNIPGKEIKDFLISAAIKPSRSRFNQQRPHQRTNRAICRSLNFKQAAGFERRRSLRDKPDEGANHSGYPGIGESGGGGGDGTRWGGERPLGASSRKGNHRKPIRGFPFVSLSR